MTTLILAAMFTSASLSTPDPKPLVSEAVESGYFIGAQRVTVCENGVCRAVEAQVPDAAATPLTAATCPSCTCPTPTPGPAACSGSASTAAVASRRSGRLLFERVRSWYPGKWIQSFREGRAAARGFCK